eukprot:gene16320-19409_t
MCSNPTYPACDKPNSCPFGEYCHIENFEGQCTPKSKVGDQCKSYIDGNCDFGLDCLFFSETNSSGVCLPQFSKQEGESCGSYLNCDVSKHLY